MTAKFKKSDMYFILNLRGVAAKSTMTANELKEMIGSVTEEEIEDLKDYREPPDFYMKELEEEGWFEKTYETVKKYVEIYVKTVPGQKVVYTPDNANSSPRVKIARMLLFYELKGRRIPIFTRTLSDKQQCVIDQTTGITVVNSGPGTGKTTTAVYKAAKLIDEGVLVVSYTNAAVENFHMKLLEVISNVGEIDKKPGKKIWLATIDSVSQIPLPKGQRRVDFDKQIEAAVRDHTQFAHVFLTLDNRPRYQHIIIDEAQDVDNPRFELLGEIYKTWQFKSMTIIGDPRQRLNIRNGAFYQELLLRGVESGDEYTLERPLVVKYNGSYRFENPLLLNLANHLSSLRPLIHSQLTSCIPMAEETPIVKFEKFEDVASEIISLVEKDVSPSQICVISPITKKSSLTKTKFDAIRQILASNRIMTSDEYKHECVYTTSIQSVKGLEFDYVFFIGASGYPSYMNAEYEDVNDGISMNFVVNTRARRSIYYLTDPTNRGPDNVPEEMLRGAQVREIIARKEIYPESIKSDDIQYSDYVKFADHNLFNVQMEEIGYFSVENTPSNYMYEIVSASLAMVKGLTTIMQMETVKPLSDESYRDYVMRGLLYDLRDKDKRIHVSNQHTEHLETLRTDYSVTDINVHKLFKSIMIGRESTLSTMEIINNIVMKVVGLIEKYTEEGELPLQGIVNYKIKTTTIETKKCILIFTENKFLASLVKKVNPLKTVIMVGLESGKIHRITKTPYTLKRYEYMVNTLFTITVHVKLIRSRGKYSLANADHSRPWYFIDTEFGPRTYNKSETIYDIALINGFDMYASTVSYLQCDRTSFNPLLNETVTYEDLIGSPTAEEFRAFFSYLIGDKKPIIHYFHASHDISIFYEGHEKYDRARETVSVSKEDWMYDPKFKYDYDFVNARVGNAKGTMSELYEKSLSVNLSSYRHIILHTAVSDAVLLAEMIMSERMI
jgi:hypothetical protein